MVSLRPRFPRFVLTLALAAPVLSAPVAMARDWRPDRLTILLGHTADGLDGRLARALARAWSRTLLAPVTVAARGRDSALSTAGEFARAPRDGTVVLAGDLGLLAFAYARERPAWIWTRTFEHLGVFALDPAVLFTGAGAGIDDLDDVVTAARDRDFTVGVGRWSSLENLVLHNAAHQAGLRLVMQPVGGGDSLVAAVTDGQVRIAVGRASDIAPHRRRVQVLAGLGILGERPIGPRTLDAALGIPAVAAGRVDAITVHAGFQRNFPARFEMLKRTLAAALEDEDYGETLDALGLAAAGGRSLDHDALMVLVRQWWDAAARSAPALWAHPEPVRSRGRIEEVADGGRRLHYLGLDGKHHEMRADPDGTELRIDGRPVGGAAPLAEIRAGMLCEIAWPSLAAREVSLLSCRMPRGAG